MIKNIFLNSTIKYIKKYYPNLTNNDIDKLKYGLEGIYLTITKLIIVLLLSIWFNILFETLILLFFYSLLRAGGYGVHATKSWICLVSSILLFVIVPLLLKIIILNIYIKLLLAFFSIIIFVLYAPADTKKRPIINKSKRLRLKIFTIVISIILLVIILIKNNEIISSYIAIALLIESILIMPITYKLSNQSYNNYKNYTIN
jgi:accessory gene regulator B